MEHNKIASIEGENMILCDTDNSATTESNMSEVGNLMEEVSQPMDMEEEEALDDAVLVPLRTMMDIDTIVVPQQVPSVELSVVIETSAERERARKPRRPYRRYTAHQIEQLFDYVIEQGKTAKDAALLTGINIRTAQHYIRRYNDDEERRLPVSGRKPGAGRKAKLTACHSHFLIGYDDEHPAAVLSDITRALCEAFPDLSISISTLHRHLVQKCKLTLKKLEKLPAARNSDRVLRLRMAKVEEWEATPELDYGKNCIFIDEAGFNLHTQRNYVQCRKGTPANGIVPTVKG
jgi:transposase